MSWNPHQNNTGNRYQTSPTPPNNNGLPILPPPFPIESNYFSSSSSYGNKPISLPPPPIVPLQPPPFSSYNIQQQQNQQQQQLDNSYFISSHQDTTGFSLPFVQNNNNSNNSSFNDNIIYNNDESLPPLHFNKPNKMGGVQQTHIPYHPQHPHQHSNNSFNSSSNSSIYSQQIEHPTTLSPIHFLEPPKTPPPSIVQFSQQQSSQNLLPFSTSHIPKNNNITTPNINNINNGSSSSNILEHQFKIPLHLPSINTQNIYNNNLNLNKPNNSNDIYLSATLQQIQKNKPYIIEAPNKPNTYFISEPYNSERNKQQTSSSSIQNSSPNSLSYIQQPKQPLYIDNYELFLNQNLINQQNILNNSNNNNITNNSNLNNNNNNNNLTNNSNNNILNSSLNTTPTSIIYTKPNISPPTTTTVSQKSSTGRGKKSNNINLTSPDHLKNIQMLMKNRISTDEFQQISLSPSSNSSFSSNSNSVIQADEILDFPEIKGKFKVLDKIGQGTFSGVYKSVCISGKLSNCVVALKRVSPTSSPARIMNEINSLMKVGGNHNVSALLGVLRHKDQVTLVLPYFEHDSFKDYFFQMTIHSFRHYLYALFTSLKHIHSHNICHRDVKPTNFLYNIKSNSFMLIDFGLAQEMLPESKEKKIIFKSNLQQTPNTNTTELKPQQAPRAGTRGFRAPEVLLKYNKQTTAIDIWSVGVIILCVISGRYPFFISPDDLTSLAEIISIIGTAKISEVAVSLDKFIHISHHIPPTSWRDLSSRLRNESSENKELIPDEIYDLLERCLDPNPFTRITASDALNHPFLLPLKGTISQ